LSAGAAAGGLLINFVFLFDVKDDPKSPPQPVKDIETIEASAK